MSKRTAALLIMLFSWLMLCVCNQTVMAAWSENSRDLLMTLGVSISLLYVGLDLVIAPETSLPYRTKKGLPFTWTTPTSVRVVGLILVLVSLVLGWASLDHLLRFIKQ